MRRLTIAASALLVFLVALSSYIYLEQRAVRKSSTHMREADSRVVSQAVHRYQVDKGRLPHSLDDLVDAGYLKALPGRLPVYSDPLPPNKGQT